MIIMITVTYIKLNSVPDSVLNAECRFQPSLIIYMYYEDCPKIA